MIHLAGILPSAFEADPLLGADVNLNGSCELLRQSAAAHVKRFIFASSMSVYGSSAIMRPLAEDDPVTPDDLYGAAKLDVEFAGQALATKKPFEFVSLRIARVVGPGIRKTSSPWRSEIFAARPTGEPVRLPFTPDAKLSLVHVQDVARMLLILAAVPSFNYAVYNTPVEIWEARQLKATVEELRGIRVELGPAQAHGGPVCDGSRFAQEFAFKLCPLRTYLSTKA